MRLRVAPTTITEARAFVEREHSHHHAPVSGLFAVGVEACPHERECPRDVGGAVLCPASAFTLRCVALVGRPVARALDQRGFIAEVTRSASDRTPHVASKCIAAAARMALAGGYTRLVSYTLLGEPGTAYLAAGWHVTGLSNRGDGWQSRDRAPAVQGGGKVRWETGPEALPADGAAALVAGFAVGCVVVPSRPETLPLLAAMGA